MESKNNAMAADDVEQDRIRVHVMIVAVLNIVAAMFYLLTVSMIVFNLYFSDFTSQYHDFAVAVSIGMVVMSIPYLLVGIGLLLRIRLARLVAILLGFIHLVEIPAGTLLGVYTLWLFLAQNTDSYFGKDPAPRLTVYSEDDLAE